LYDSQGSPNAEFGEPQRVDELARQQADWRLPKKRLSKCGLTRSAEIANAELATSVIEPIHRMPACAEPERLVLQAMNAVQRLVGS
jgi:hypothetical protein